MYCLLISISLSLYIINRVAVALQCWVCEASNGAPKPCENGESMVVKTCAPKEKTCETSLWSEYIIPIF